MALIQTRRALVVAVVVVAAFIVATIVVVVCIEVITMPFIVGSKFEVLGLGLGSRCASQEIPLDD